MSLIPVNLSYQIRPQKNKTLDLYVLNMVLVIGGDDRRVLLWNLNKDISDYESKDNSYFCF